LKKDLLSFIGECYKGYYRVMKIISLIAFPNKMRNKNSLNKLFIVLTLFINIFLVR